MSLDTAYGNPNNVNWDTQPKPADDTPFLHGGGAETFLGGLGPMIVDAAAAKSPRGPAGSVVRAGAALDNAVGYFNEGTRPSSVPFTTVGYWLDNVDATVSNTETWLGNVGNQLWGSPTPSWGEAGPVESTGDTEGPGAAAGE